MNGRQVGETTYLRIGAGRFRVTIEAVDRHAGRYTVAVGGIAQDGPALIRYVAEEAVDYPGDLRSVARIPT
jgi:hypothetical protein